MANWNDPRGNRTDLGRTSFGASPGLNGEAARGTTFDAGLRKHMLSIYNYMASGVLLTGLVALGMVQTGMVYSVLSGPLAWIVMLSPLAIVFGMSFGQNKFSTGTLQAMFWGFAVLMGMSLSTIFLAYTGASIALTFFATAGAFAGLSLYGYTTSKDLSGFGTFLVMGVIGLIIASLLNMFLQSPGLSWAISAIGVLIFAGLTAWDTQRLKTEYVAVQQMTASNPAAAAQYPLGKMVIMGALSLYLDFINMFLFLLRFMGSRE